MLFRSLAWISPLAAQRLDVDAAALRTCYLTDAPEHLRHPAHGLPQHRSDPGRWRRHHGGRVGPIDCVASASTSYDCPVMLVRREGESFVALLKRLDRSIAKAWEQEISIDEVNG